jgi:hypothetical protein
MKFRVPQGILLGVHMDDDDNFTFQATWNMIKQIADTISHSSIAVAELAKNSYDADATEVLINMKEAMGKKQEDCKLVIMDDGYGMSKEDIKTKWANMGVSANTSQPFSPKGRSKQGGKGLGRFGAWKIGKKVTIATRAKGHPVYSLSIDFSLHSPDTPLQDVMTPIITDPPAFRNLFAEGKTGTYILVEKFRSTMKGAEDLGRIHRATQTLLNPFEPESDFKITLQLPKKFEKWEDYELLGITDQALYKFEVSIDAMGQSIEGTYSNNNPYSKFFGETEQINLQTKDLLSGEKCQIGAVKVWIYHFNKSAEYKALFPRTNLGNLSREVYTKELSGFRLYKDSVRVFPYGEYGNDWLQLDKYKINTPIAWFSNTQLVAAARFDMNRNKSVMIDKSNREGLEETIGKAQLFRILQQLVKIMREKANKDYPKKQPPHLKEPDFEYGKFSLTVGQTVNILVRNKGGDITKNYSVTRGKLPKGLSLDTKTGTVSGAPLSSLIGKSKIEITSGNNQGNHTGSLIINGIQDPQPASLNQTGIVSGETPGHTASSLSPFSSPSPPVRSNPSGFEQTISDFTNKVNLLNSTQEVSEIKKIFEDLKKHLDRILEDSNFE